MRLTLNPTHPFLPMGIRATLEIYHSITGLGQLAYFWSKIVKMTGDGTETYSDTDSYLIPIKLLERETQSKLDFKLILIIAFSWVIYITPSGKWRENREIGVDLDREIEFL